MGHAEELDLDLSDADFLAVGGDIEASLGRESFLFQALTDKGHRELGAEARREVQRG